MVFRHPELLLLLLLAPAAVLAWRRRPTRIAGPAVALRVAIVALAVAALADPVYGARPARPDPALALVVDQSDSLGDAGRAELRRRALAAAAGYRGRVEVVYFGANQAAIPADRATGGAAGGAAPELPPPGADLRADGSDIAGALRAATALVGRGGRIVLLTDGLPTDGDTLAAAAAAGAAGVPVDTQLYVAPGAPDAWLQSVSAPTSLREGEEFEAQVVVGSSGAGQATVSFAAGGGQPVEQEVTLAPGENRFTYSAKAGQPGVLTMRAAVRAEGDSVARNDEAAATALVAPAPRVLVVEGTPAAARPLVAALQPLSIVADVVAPADVPSRLSALGGYESVVLLDVSASDLTLDQMAALREFVRSEGRGLVAAGGRSSFTLGSYRDTPLEQALPVSMDPPAKGERPDISMLMMIDQSASMGPEDGDTKFNMAKEAAILTTESLRENDRIGVMAFDINQQWVVPFQQIGAALSIAQLQEQIARVPLGGGTDILAALEAGVPALEGQPGPVRHAILLTDGRSFTNNRPAYRTLVEQMHARGLTLSTIAIGSDADTELLRELAQIGGGRYHFASTPDDIPRLTLLESQILRTEPQVEGQFRAELVSPHPALRGFEASELPGLQGYVATTVKPDAELVLESPQHDPVLAAWQYGLGRAVAWTPGAEAPWAADWSNWPEYGRFWAGLIRYTLPEPDSGPLQLRVTPRGQGATLSADVLGPGGVPLDLADVEASLTLPDGSSRGVKLQQVAPGRYASDITLPSEGAYAITARAVKGDVTQAGTAGYALGYPREYLPASAREGGGPTGQALLDAVQAASRPPGGTQAAAPGQAGSDGLPLWPLLAALAAMLWPVEVAIRRGWISV